MCPCAQDCAISNSHVAEEVGAPMHSLEGLADHVLVVGHMGPAVATRVYFLAGEVLLEDLAL